LSRQAGRRRQLGAEAAIKASPRRIHYRILHLSSYTINRSAQALSRFDGRHRAIGTFTDEADGLTVNPTLPVKTLKELVWLCKASPASSPMDAAARAWLVISARILPRAAGIKATTLPYRGTAPAPPTFWPRNLQLTGGTTTIVALNQERKARPRDQLDEKAGRRRREHSILRRDRESDAPTSPCGTA